LKRSAGWRTSRSSARKRACSSCHRFWCSGFVFPPPFLQRRLAGQDVLVSVFRDQGHLLRDLLLVSEAPEGRLQLSARPGPVRPRAACARRGSCSPPNWHTAGRPLIQIPQRWQSACAAAAGGCRGLSTFLSRTTRQIALSADRKRASRRD
jgi:hypothetical protein